MNGLTRRPRRAPLIPSRFPLRLALVPLEELGALVERLLHERAGDVAALPPVRAPERSLAGRRVDATDRDLIDPELPRRLGEHRFDDRDGCMPPGAAGAGGGVLVRTEMPRKRIASGW